MSSEYRNEILLESGTNEIEIMEFTIAGNVFGINVAKVREIMIPMPVKPMPHAHPAVEGIFKPRGQVLTVVDLPQYLNLSAGDPDDRNLFIVTNFNKMHVAFRVHSVVEIHRISWEAIQKPDNIIYGGDEGVATGLAECKGRLVTILDFEKIVAEISPTTSIQMSEIEAFGKRSQDNRPIIICEDSNLLSKLIIECLNKAGYTNIIKFDNGQEAWDYLEEIENDEKLFDKVSLIITDIEMPKMDGHRLTKLIKSHARMKNIPVIIFSSLIDEDMRIKGKQIGADEQMSKPEIGNLVLTIDRLINSY
ncbi:MAG: chemotaxis protein [Oscillospiraceae bacterium]|nr:chemotaxis protein [Oscillospiraceae bacterium]